jgi:hypothetical protein
MSTFSPELAAILANVTDQTCEAFHIPSKDTHDREVIAAASVHYGFNLDGGVQGTSRLPQLFHRARTGRPGLARHWHPSHRQRIESVTAWLLVSRPSHCGAICKGGYRRAAFGVTLVVIGSAVLPNSGNILRRSGLSLRAIKEILCRKNGELSCHR